MKLSLFSHWRPFVGVTLIKIRVQRDPNEDWRYGAGISIMNLGIALYWKATEYKRPQLTIDHLHLRCS
jgi:hypothetical protein